MIDFTKPVRTKSGEPVEIISTEGRGRFQVLGYAGESDYVSSWTIGGRRGLGVSSDDLENIPQKRSGWVLVKAGYLGHRSLEDPTKIFKTKDLAQAAAARYACHLIPAYIEWEE